MTYHADLYWTSSDMQSDMDMSGDYDTTDRTRAARLALLEMLDQASDDDDRGWILAGSIDGVACSDLID